MYLWSWTPCPSYWTSLLFEIQTSTSFSFFLWYYQSHPPSFWFSALAMLVSQIQRFPVPPSLWLGELLFLLIIFHACATRMGNQSVELRLDFHKSNRFMPCWALIDPPAAFIYHSHVHHSNPFPGAYTRQFKRWKEASSLLLTTGQLLYF